MWVEGCHDEVLEQSLGSYKRNKYDELLTVDFKKWDDPSQGT